MRILFCEWGAPNEAVIAKTLRDLGHFVRELKMKELPQREVEEEVIFLAHAANEYHAELYFTVDYFPNLAMAAKRAGILYYSWLFHLPQWNLYSYQAQLPCNRIFIFDKMQIKDLRQQNINTTQYISLPADKQILENALEGAATKCYRFQGDVSYVGAVLDNGVNSGTKFTAEARNDERFAKLVEVIKEKKFSYGNQVLYRGVPDDVIEFLSEETAGDKNNYFFARKEDIIIQSVLARKITAEERKTACRMLARKFDLKVYSESNLERYPEINNLGPVNMLKEAPLIYNQSKVNVYVAPRCIRSGIPQRVLEIIACRGFLITNYQEDLAQEFEEDREIVMFRNLDELVSKTAYYLTHEQERQEIIRAGYEKVLREYNYAEKLRKILDAKSGSSFGF